jgi:hypothetical protein
VPSAATYDDGNVPLMETKAKRPLSSNVTMKDDGTLHSSMQKASKTTANADAVSSFSATNDAITSSQKKYAMGISSALASMMADGGTLPSAMDLDSSSVKDVCHSTIVCEAQRHSIIVKEGDTSSLFLPYDDERWHSASASDGD